jgi:choline dehydrogenase
VRHDVIICGAGSAGCVLAARLTEDPDRSVLLLEAGPTGPLDTDAEDLTNIAFALTARDWGLKATVSGGRVLDYPQGRFVGGGSSVNGGLAFRGVPADYDDWALDAPSWSWEHLLPFFRRLEHDMQHGSTAIHGGDGPIPVTRYAMDELVPMQCAFRDGCLDAGFAWNDDLNGPDALGVGALPMNRAGRRRISTAIAYLQPALGRPNLTVWGGAQVARVLISGGRATGVDVVRDGRLESIDGGEVILSAGAIQSPAILWRSGIGPARALGVLGIEVAVANEAVGANLHDHPGAFVFTLPVAGAPGPYDPQYQLGVRYSSTLGGRPNDMLLSVMNEFDLTASPDFAAVVGAPTARVLTCGVHDPVSRGHVSLTSADPTAPPVVDFNLLSAESDVLRLVEGLRLCRRVLEAPAMCAFVGPPVLPSPQTFDDDDALAASSRSIVAGWYHPVGTCRMGAATTGDGAVVDDALRVHGAERLRVVDASVMPRICRAPTNLTTIAIAERAAALIAG